MPRILFILIIISTLRLLAAPHPDLIEQFNAQSTEKIAFYKNKSSQFASGYASFEKLSDAMIEIDNSEEYFFRQNAQKISPSLVPYLTAFDLSRTWITKYTKKKIAPLENLPLAEILLNYETDPLDRGLIITLKKTLLKSEPSLKGATLDQVDEFKKFIPIAFDQGFIKILYNKKFGFIDINDCMTKFDFAKFIFPYNSKTNQWMPVKSRQFTSIETQKNELFSMGLVQALVVDEKLSLVYKNNPHLPIWTSLKIEKDISDPWRKSELKGHGLVYWKKPLTKPKYETEIDIDQIMKKEIFSISFLDEKFNKKSNKGIVSTDDGVFITDNGQQWHPVSQFKSYKGPVNYFSDKIIFVGSFKSSNGGESFDNYIRVDKISEAIAKNTGFLPKRIKITKIKTFKPFHLILDVESQGHIYSLKSSLLSQDWQIIKK